ncbi:hypothetical protein P170DRAFT_514079 [Aspergillus steynii IBT 23096]|uniref:Zn(2)-C6 fungal-type domain-containing protein n=1 Tax=Aspergillus steynii IBT 23096 TaxID=1392250 RepID=A0A2I2FT17_9EURO|nr:uncharacterized protein P170DRAFT_514079 [Aspergillus steynii IBT 23096]PLB43751.1 hypothetical protein P170DRAFT_514079 [Aspergillus steynii IBT 23096]
MKPFNPACNTCCIKKRRCDRVKPVCSGCIKRGLSDACFYRTEDMPAALRDPRRGKTHHSWPSPPMVVVSSPPAVTPFSRLETPKQGLEWSSGETSEATREENSGSSEILEVKPEDVSEESSDENPEVKPEDDSEDSSDEDLEMKPEEDSEESADEDPKVKPEDISDSEQSSEERSKTRERTFSGFSPEFSRFSSEFSRFSSERAPSHDRQDNLDDIEVSSAHSDESFHTAVLPHEPPTPNANGPRPFQIAGQKETHEQTDRLGEENGRDPPLTPRRFNPINDVRSPAHDPKCRQSSEQITPDLADRLVAAYLTHEYANLPIFDLTEFRSSYDIIRMGQNISAGSGSFHGLLITIFSLSGLTCHDVGETDLSSLFKYGQAVSRNFDSHSTPAERAQSYILQSQYLYASGDPREALTSIGFAIRIAQVLGLEVRTRDRHSRDHELARRLWHGAMLLERMIAFQLRHPLETLRRFRVPLPTHMDTDYIDAISKEAPSPDEERASIVQFLVACVKLYEHVGEILTWEEKMKMRRGSCAAEKLLLLHTSTLLHLDASLYQWQTSLPSFLQKPGPEMQPIHPVVRRQRAILRVRYLYVRLRLFRPLLILGLAACDKCSCQAGSNPHFRLEESSPDCPLALSVIRDSSLKCIAAALELVTLCEHEQESISPSWEILDYLYVCGTVFLAAQSCPFLSAGSRGQPDPEEMELSLGRVLDLLESYQSIHPSDRIYDIAQRCRRTLESVSAIVEGSDEAAVFDDDRSRRLLERMKMCNPGDNDEPGQSDSSRLGLFGWLGSLPDDLAGELE